MCCNPWNDCQWQELADIKDSKPGDFVSLYDNEGNMNAFTIGTVRHYAETGTHIFIPADNSASYTTADDGKSRWHHSTVLRKVA